MENKKKKAKGKIPNSTWLVANNYGALYKCLRDYPELFEHIEREKMIKTPEEWVPIAEQLAKNNEDMLTNYSWLVKNEYNGLLFEPNDSLDLANKIQTLLEDYDKCIRLGKNGFNYIKEYHSPEIHYQKLMDLFKMLKNN